MKDESLITLLSVFGAYFWKSNSKLIFGVRKSLHKSAIHHLIFKTQCSNEIASLQIDPHMWWREVQVTKFADTDNRGVRDEAQVALGSFKHRRIALLLLIIADRESGCEWCNFRRIFRTRFATLYESRDVTPPHIPAHTHMCSPRLNQWGSKLGAKVTFSVAVQLLHTQALYPKPFAGRQSCPALVRFRSSDSGQNFPRSTWDWERVGYESPPVKTPTVRTRQRGS